MKSMKQVIIIILFLCTLFVPQKADAFYVNIGNGIRLTIGISGDGNGARVVGYTGDNCGNLVIPSHVLDSSTGITYTITSIGYNAFTFCSSLTSVSIPNSVTSIGIAAFGECSNLTSITIPDNVVTIGEAAFAGCSNLSSLIIGNSVDSIGHHAFANCPSLSSIVFNADSCVYIGLEVFDNDNITSIVFGNNVRHIPNWLCHQMALTSVSIPNSVVSIGEEAFSLCESLSTISLGSNLKTIGDYAFCDCYNLQSFNLPNSLTCIGEYAFAQCTNLSSLSIPNSVAKICDYAFYECTNLATINLCSGIRNIGAGAFAGCTSLTSIVIPDGVRYLGGAFWYCSNLSSVVIGNGVDTIYNTFVDCISLESITIPEGVTYLGGWTFLGCENLATVTLGSDVTYIGDGAFEFCGLTDIYSNNPTAPVLGNDVFIGVDNHINVHIPCGSFNSYNANWGTSHGSGLNFFIEGAFPFSVSAVSGNENMGTVQIVTEPTCSTPQMTIQAIANSGYHFTHWQDGNTENPRTITVTSDTTINAYFAINQYTLTVFSNDNTKGNVSGGGVYDHGVQATVTATPTPGNRFNQWNDGTTQNPYNIIMTGDLTLIATFVIDEVIGRVDTVYIENTVHDTTININNVHDTTYINVYDTTYIDVPYAVHDTTIINDTAFVDVYDTTYVSVHDTTYINVPYAVHDTIIVTLTDTVITTVYDTTILTDTVTEYVLVHDTTVVTWTDTVINTLWDSVFITVYDTVEHYIFDTITNTFYDTVANTVFDTIDNYIYDTLTVTDTLWLTLTDTLWLHDTIIIYDTVYVTEESVDGLEVLNAKVYSSQGMIVVEGANGNEVTLFDINGRTLFTRRDYGTAIRFDVPVSGTYMIKIGNHPTRKVVVIR